MVSGRLRSQLLLYMVARLLVRQTVGLDGMVQLGQVLAGPDEKPLSSHSLGYHDDRSLSAPAHADQQLLLEVLHMLDTVGYEDLLLVYAMAAQPKVRLEDDHACLVFS